MLLGLNRKEATGIMLFLSVLHPPSSVLPSLSRKEAGSQYENKKDTRQGPVIITSPHPTADRASQSLEARLHQLAVKSDYCFGKQNP